MRSQCVPAVDQLAMVTKVAGEAFAKDCVQLLGDRSRDPLAWLAQLSDLIRFDSCRGFLLYCSMRCWVGRERIFFGRRYPESRGGSRQNLLVKEFHLVPVFARNFSDC